MMMGQYLTYNLLTLVWKLDDEAGMVETRYQVTATMGMEDDSADNRGGKENEDFTIYIYGVIGSSRN